MPKHPEEGRLQKGSFVDWKTLKDRKQRSQWSLLRRVTSGIYCTINIGTSFIQHLHQYLGGNTKVFCVVRCHTNADGLQKGLENIEWATEQRVDVDKCKVMFLRIDIQCWIWKWKSQLRKELFESPLKILSNLCSIYNGSQKSQEDVNE